MTPLRPEISVFDVFAYGSNEEIDLKENPPDEAVDQEYPPFLAPIQQIDNYLGKRLPDKLECSIGGRSVRIYGLNQDEADLEHKSVFENLIFPVIQNAQLNRVIAAHTHEWAHIEEGEIDPKLAPETLHSLGEYVEADLACIVVGERYFEKMQKELEIFWKLPEENVEKMRALIQAKQPKIDALLIDDYFSTEGVEYISASLARELMQYLQEDRDYYFPDPFLENLLPVMTINYRSWPRLEKIKTAFREYFAVVDLSSSVTDSVEFYLDEEDPEEKELLYSKLELNDKLLASKISQVLSDSVAGDLLSESSNPLPSMETFATMEALLKRSLNKMCRELNVTVAFVFRQNLYYFGEHNLEIGHAISRDWNIHTHAVYCAMSSR